MTIMHVDGNKKPQRADRKKRKEVAWGNGG